MAETNKKREKDEDKVEEAGEESFPASDPPSYATPQRKKDRAPDEKDRRDSPAQPGSTKPK